MTVSDWIALSALGISLTSLGMSAYIVFLDRPRLKATAKHVLGYHDFSEEHLVVKITNSGRQAAVLRLFGGTLESGSTNAEYLGEKNHGLRLGSHEFYERVISREAIYVQTPDEESRFREFWFEDSLGTRHKVKGSKEAIHNILLNHGDVLK